MLLQYCGEVSKLLADDIIEPTNSPWWAQVVVTKSKNYKKLMCVDYSQTISLSASNNAECFKEGITLHIFFKTNTNTRFKAVRQLYQFKRIHFGLKKSCFQSCLSCFQRVINQIISDYKCEGTFACILTI